MGCCLFQTRNNRKPIQPFLFHSQCVWFKVQLDEKNKVKGIHTKMLQKLHAARISNLKYTRFNYAPAYRFQANTNGFQKKK